MRASGEELVSLFVTRGPRAPNHAREDPASCLRGLEYTRRTKRRDGRWHEPVERKSWLFPAKTATSRSPLANLRHRHWNIAILAGYSLSRLYLKWSSLVSWDLPTVSRIRQTGEATIGWLLRATLRPTFGAAVPVPPARCSGLCVWWSSVAHVIWKYSRTIGEICMLCLFFSLTRYHD